MSADPVLKPIGESLWVIWPERCTLEFSRLHEGSDTLSAEVSVVSALSGELSWARLNLASVQSRNALARALEEREPSADWLPMLERSCRLVAKHVRAGAPAVPLIAQPPAADQWLVDGLIPMGQLSCLYGDGGVGKSYCALALLLAGLLDRPLSPRWRVAPIRRALYLDWESDTPTQARRLWRLAEGLGSQPVDGAILHRTMRRPLVDEFSAIRGEVARHEVDVVIADSLAPACGPDPETATAVVPTLEALRSLAVTVLMLAHVTKASAETRTPAQPWGSVFIKNLARSTIECRRSEPVSDAESPSYVLSLYHRKANEGHRVAPSGLEFTFLDERVTVRDAPADAQGASLPYQILEALVIAPQNPKELAEALDANPQSVARTLRRLEKAGKVIPLTRTKGGRSQENTWARIDTTRTENPDTAEHDVRVSDEPVPF